MTPIQWWAQSFSWSGDVVWKTSRSQSQAIRKALFFLVRSHRQEIVRCPVSGHYLKCISFNNRVHIRHDSLRRSITRSHQRAGIHRLIPSPQGILQHPLCMIYDVTQDIGGVEPAFHHHLMDWTMAFMRHPRYHLGMTISSTVFSPIKTHVMFSSDSLLSS